MSKSTKIIVAGLAGLIVLIIVLSFIFPVENNASNNSNKSKVSKSVDTSKVLSGSEKSQRSHEASKYESSKIELKQGQLNVISALQDSGWLSIEPKLNRAYINPDLWRNMKYRLKEDFAAGLAIYCADKKGTHIYWVEIYDLYSGKKLAKYSRTWGFKVY